MQGVLLFFVLLSFSQSFVKAKDDQMGDIVYHVMKSTIRTQGVILISLGPRLELDVARLVNQLETNWPIEVWNQVRMQDLNAPDKDSRSVFVISSPDTFAKLKEQVSMLLRRYSTVNLVLTADTVDFGPLDLDLFIAFIIQPSPQGYLLSLHCPKTAKAIYTDFWPKNHGVIRGKLNEFIDVCNQTPDVTLQASLLGVFPYIRNLEQENPTGAYVDVLKLVAEKSGFRLNWQPEKSFGDLLQSVSQFMFLLILTQPCLVSSGIKWKLVVCRVFGHLAQNKDCGYSGGSLQR